MRFLVLILDICRGTGLIGASPLLQKLASGTSVRSGILDLGSAEDMLEL